MRRLIPTLILVIICVGGFWYASSQDFFKEKKDTPPPLAKVTKTDVASYTIKSGDTEIELQQKDGKWTMTKPSAVPLNDYTANGWIDSFNLLSKEATIDAEGKDLAKFGLDKPQQQFTVKLNNGTEQTLSVGNAMLVQGFDYAMFSGSPEVFKLSDSQVKSLALAQMDFMEKSPIKLEYEQVRGVNVEWQGAKYTLTKTDTDKKSYEANWKLGDKEVKGADASPYLDKIQFLSTDQPAKPAGEVKIDAPELRIEVKSADTSGKETTTVYLGKVQQDNVWIAQQDGQWAYSLPVATVQELADKFKEPPEQPEPSPAPSPSPSPAAQPQQ
ncbi:DUF4340 domain-containing protein [Paenibacillus doosanensis]|uniref:DUF4340 domain-containing protein n=1 Tax=Paenibacillus doosanensis TaxID=1229154 RepID=UPI0021803934|nr:DUF4340 domain-containing protein [Paenibacillus doosanensis]MCS7459880.1 DUF4340 domain-containing protein [Paenibacillus doosanensis]